MIIKLTQGKEAIVDEDDFEVLSQFKWCFERKMSDGRGYAVRNAYPVDGYHPKKIYLHRVVMKAGEGELVDHINCDSLDNRKENLRFTSRSVNGKNLLRPRTRPSGLIYKPRKKLTYA